MTYVHKMAYDKIDEKLPAFHILVVQITIPCIYLHEQVNPTIPDKSYNSR